MQLLDCNLYVAQNTGFSILRVSQERGDTNNDGTVSALDIVNLINYLFRMGPAPIPLVSEGDANFDGQVSLIDIVHVVNHVFRGGPLPGCL